VSHIAKISFTWTLYKPWRPLLSQGVFWEWVRPIDFYTVSEQVPLTMIDISLPLLNTCLAKDATRAYFLIVIDKPWFRLWLRINSYFIFESCDCSSFVVRLYIPGRCDTRFIGLVNIITKKKEKNYNLVLQTASRFANSSTNCQHLDSNPQTIKNF